MPSLFTLNIYRFRDMSERTVTVPRSPGISSRDLGESLLTSCIPVVQERLRISWMPLQTYWQGGAMTLSPEGAPT